MTPAPAVNSAPAGPPLLEVRNLQVHFPVYGGIL